MEKVLWQEMLVNFIPLFWICDITPMFWKGGEGEKDHDLHLEMGK